MGRRLYTKLLENQGASKKSKTAAHSESSKERFSNIKLEFPPYNTISKLQLFDENIIKNFKVRSEG